jgi:hypothetical protein
MSDAMGRVAGEFPTTNMSARSTAALLENPGCERRAVLDAAGVHKAKLAAHVGQPTQFGQSPFAIGQGNRFESRVKDDGYAELVRVLGECLPAFEGMTAPEALDLNTVGAGPADRVGRVAGTQEALRQIVAGEVNAPNVLDHAMTTLRVGHRIVYLEQDALAFRDGDKLRICEVKGFPIVDGSADPGKTGAAVRQTAVYLASIQDTLEAIGADPAMVSPEVVLICPRNYSITPTGVLLDVSREVRALRRQLDRQVDVESLIAELPEGFALPDPVNDPGGAEARATLGQLKPSYEPGCLGRCDLARHCRAESKAEDRPDRLGEPANNLLAGIATVSEAVELSKGGPTTEDNAEVAKALADARRAMEAARWITGAQP